MLPASFKYLPPPQLLQHTYLTTCNLLVQSTTEFFNIFIYLFVYTYLTVLNAEEKVTQGLLKPGLRQGF